MSNANNRLPRSAGVICPLAMRWASASARALLPTPGSPSRQGLFFWRRQRISIIRQTLLAGALFHDFGKIREFSGGIANDYTDEGRLLGHLEICVEMLAPYLEKSGLEPELQRHLKHLVLSHHGTLEFGAVRVPQTAEALVLHYADNIDAKMAQCRGLFAQLGDGESWTPYQATLGRAMHRCARTPVEEKVEKKPRASRKPSGEDGMLSLL